MNKFLAQLRFYIDLPGFILIAVVAALFWRPSANLVFRGTSWVNEKVNAPLWAENLLLGVIGNVIAAVIIGFFLFWLLRKRDLSAVCGKFQAFDVVDGTRQPWGNLDLRHQLIATSSMGPRLHFKLTNNDITIFGEGILTREQHFIGFYRETGRPARRRMGSFFLTLDGSGDGYDGDIVYLDPVTNAPSKGIVRWQRVA